MPPIPGIDSPHVLLCKNWDHAMAIKERAGSAKSAVVIGAGYIGAEIAEQFSEIGVKTTLVDALDRVLANNFDATITDDVEQAFDEHGVTLALGQKVTAFRPAAGSDGIEGSGVTVVTEKGEYTADMAILGAGFRPNTALFADQLRMLKNGAIVIDDYMRASLPDNTVLDDVFAAGDSATVRYNPTGADDYITKPFSPKELVARIKAVMRRISPMAVEEVIEMQGLSLDPTSHRVMTGENPLDMGPTEFKLLHFFMTHPERVYSREQLLNNVWGTNVYVEDRTVDVHIRRLRKALELSGHDRMVQTVRGTGYRFSTRF